MRCVGFGEFEGKCQRKAGTPWTPYWCMRCDELRRGHISKQLDKIVEKFKRGDVCLWKMVYEGFYASQCSPPGQVFSLEQTCPYCGKPISIVSSQTPKEE